MNMTRVFTATWDWAEIAKPEIDWDAEPIQYGSQEWLQACELGGYDPADDEVGFGVLKGARDCDTALRPEDIVGTAGYGSDYVFIRV
jgi:hypothetical protein